jgi:phage repressor protein C with HTH and peptisase S24 domain
MARQTSTRVTRSIALQPAITSAVATVDSHPAFSGMSAKTGELYIPERFARVSLRRYSDARVMRTDGDCMAPLLHHGDYVVISPSAPLVVGELVAFRVSAARWGVKQLAAAGGHAAPREPTIARPASARRHQRIAGRARP